MSGEICEMQPEKINGFDKYDVESDARTLIKAKELENTDKKYYETLIAEVEKTAKAATEAAAVKTKAADSLKLEKKVGKKLKEVMGGSGE
jgi:hypothetical protein